MKPNSIKSLALEIVGGLILMGFVFYNGLPCLYSDTGTYLNSGFEIVSPPDRPIVYGLLVRLSSLNGVSLWLTTLFQAVVFAWLIRLTLSFSTQNTISTLWQLIFIVLISIGTTASFITSSILTDVFAPISILAMFHLLIHPTLNLNLLHLYGQ